MSAPAAERITVTQDGAVATIRFFPTADGTITSVGAGLLADGVTALLADDSVRAIILTGGVPGIFIRHANIAEIAGAAEAVVAGAITEDGFLDSAFQRLCGALDAAHKPVIAAINGLCMGGGFEIALACTMRIAAAAVDRIGLPEIRLDIPPGAGGPQRLARLIGGHRARLFALDGRLVDAPAALDLGLVDGVAADAVAEAGVRAAALARRSPAVVAALMAQMRPDDAPAIADNARYFAHCLLAPGAVTSLRQLADAGTPIDTLP